MAGTPAIAQDSRVSPNSPEPSEMGGMAQGGWIAIAGVIAVVILAVIAASNDDDDAVSA